MRLLTRFKSGSTIEQACEWLGEAGEEGGGEGAIEEAEQNLHLWIQNWILKGWLSTELSNEGTQSSSIKKHFVK
jgi:hypothetical protein